MGMECTLFVGYKTTVSNRVFGGHGLFCPRATIHLQQERDLWPQLRALPSEPLGGAVHAQHASWSHYSDGSRPVGQDNRELGFVAVDAYNEPLRVVAATALSALTSKYEENRRILAFVQALGPGLAALPGVESRVVLYWW